MKQILQNLKTGATDVAEVPAPGVSRGSLLIHTSRTLISAGTERMLVDFGKANLLEKARKEPDRVKMVLAKVRTDGLLPTLESVRNKLDQPLPLGYCNVGVVAECGAGVTGFGVGDRVASNGKHAEVVSVPVNLCARIPDGVSDDAAAFTVVGSIALQGIRLAQPTLGEAIVVTGLGLIGLMTVQLLRAHGCRVLGIDFDPVKLALARTFGAETVDLSAGQDPIGLANRFSRGRGVDAVLLTAATQSNEPMHQAALMCRQRGRIVLVGVVGLDLLRDDFYKKELTLQVSSSYGPGRYDTSYEEEGQDYPVGFVRWTEQRNFEAVLDMMTDGRIDVKPLISHRIAITDAEEAYQIVGGSEPSLGILLEYPAPTAGSEAHLGLSTIVFSRGAAHTATSVSAKSKPTVAFIGSGNYATAVLIPAFKATGARLRTVASRSGVSGVHAARKFGFDETTTQTDVIFADASIDAVVITTRHDSHARFVERALSAGKHVFVEKPLALTLAEVNAIESGRAHAAVGSGAPLVMVGFNRRFAPHVQKMKSLLEGVREPKVIAMTVNAGALPADHWAQDRLVGGGRIIGEGCHFIDLLRFLVGAPIVGFEAMSIGATPGSKVTDDKSSINLSFADGSLGSILYVASGHKSFPKERLEVFTAGRVLQMDNFRKLTGFGWPGFSSMKLWRQDKGQAACASAFVSAIEQGKPSPIPFDEVLEVSRVSIEVAESLR